MIAKLLIEDDTTLTVELPENEIVDDVRFMVSNYVAQSKERNARWYEWRR